jgi:hypothetical protein
MRDSGVAANARAAPELLEGFLLRSQRQLVFVDVVRDNPWAPALLAAHGFQFCRPLTRMCRGENAHPGRPELLCAILGPEFGQAPLMTDPFRPRVFYGWWIVLAAFLNLFFAVGIVFYGFPVFYPPLVASLHLGIWVTRSAPRNLGLWPDGSPSNPATAGVARAPSRTAREAAGTANFWLLLGSMLVIGVTGTAISHFILFLKHADFLGRGRLLWTCRAGKNPRANYYGRLPGTNIWARAGGSDFRHPPQL